MIHVSLSFDSDPLDSTFSNMPMNSLPVFLIYPKAAEHRFRETRGILKDKVHMCIYTVCVRFKGRVGSVIQINSFVIFVEIVITSRQ